MHFKINLNRTRGIPELPLHYEEELDDIRSILSDICEALADTSSADFIISGFGQDRWPVDVRTDLPIFLEQLPAAAAAVESGTPFSLDFYEQGLERIVHFEPQDELYYARCESQTEWKPDPAVETIAQLELKKMFFDVRESLMQFLSQNAPRAATHPWMQDWAATVRK